MTRRPSRWWLALCCALGLVFVGPASAGRILVLVHGYLGDAASWQQSGVLPVLEQAGWKLALPMPRRFCLTSLLGERSLRRVTPNE